MDLFIRMSIVYIVKYHYVIRLKFGDKFLTSLTKLETFQAKANILHNQKNLLLYCRKFLAFVVVVII